MTVSRAVVMTLLVGLVVVAFRWLVPASWLIDDDGFTGLMALAVLVGVAVALVAMVLGVMFLWRAWSHYRNWR